MVRVLTRLGLYGCAIVAGLGVSVPSASAASQAITAVVTTLPPSGAGPASGPEVGFGTGVGHFTATFFTLSGGRECVGGALAATFTLDDGTGNSTSGTMQATTCSQVTLPYQHMTAEVSGGTGSLSGATGTGTFDGLYVAGLSAGVLQLAVST